MSILADLLSTLFERRYASDGEKDDRPLFELFHDLLTSRGDVSGVNLARRILDRYALLDDDGKREVFEYLYEHMDIDVPAVESALADYAAARSHETYRRLVRAAEPDRQEFARRLNQVPGATARLVEMRTDLLRFSRDNPALLIVDQDFRHLFGSWFNRGFLVLRAITWSSPANILEKIIAYESVHAIQSWDDLRLRLEPEDRRCFAFFHPAMPDEPLIFVEVALTRGIAGSIQDVLAEEREILPRGDANTAVFYSISNCQAGLAGISFGNSLIKQVVADLSREVPELETFVTLSPIPGLAAWLEGRGLAGAVDDPARLAALTARYIVEAKRDDGKPLDPVARFHLNNGAVVHRVHPRGDLSSKGLAQSGGAMVNYLYDLKKIEQNHENYANHQKVAASKEVLELSRSARDVEPAEKRKTS